MVTSYRNRHSDNGKTQQGEGIPKIEAEDQSDDIPEPSKADPERPKNIQNLELYTEDPLDASNNHQTQVKPISSGSSKNKKPNLQTLKDYVKNQEEEDIIDKSYKGKSVFICLIHWKRAYKTFLTLLSLNNPNLQFSEFKKSYSDFGDLNVQCEGFDKNLKTESEKCKTIVDEFGKTLNGFPWNLVMFGRDFAMQDFSKCDGLLHLARYYCKGANKEGLPPLSELMKSKFSGE